MTQTLILAHRGASGYAPENTIAAFKKAISLGADGIETDVQLSKDNEIVLIHDESVDRTTDGRGYIKDLTLKEIKKLDAGRWFNDKFIGQRVPILEELLSLAKDKDILLNIELKNNVISYKNIEEKVVNLINRYNLKDRVIISSFNHTSLLKIKHIDSDIRTGMLYMSRLSNPIAHAKAINADALHPSYKRLSRRLIDAATQNKLMINTFTVNRKEHIKKLKEVGVTSIITDYPDIHKSIT